MAEAAVARKPANGNSANGGSVALLVFDNECRVLEANLSACRLLGAAREDVAGQGFGTHLVPAAAERLERAWSAAREAGGRLGPFALAWPASLPSVELSVTPAVLPGRHLVILAPPGAGTAGAREGSDAGRLPTAREREILELLAGGDTDVQIAERLDLSPATVQTHVRNAKAKLGARTRAQAVALAMRRGVINA